MNCPRCDIPMTQGAPHADNDAYQHECHRCGYVQGVPAPRVEERGKAEVISLRGNEPPGHFAVAAVVLAEKAGTTVPHLPQGGVEVYMEVNGAQVPFGATIEEIYRRMQDEVNKIAAEKALEYVELKQLGILTDEISQVRDRIKEAIGKAFGIEWPEEY